MAFDGVTVAAVVKEIADSCIGGRINKIAQPEPDELLLTIKTGGEQKKLLISAGASLPLIYFTQGSKQSPMTAPGFCMLLRKHLQNGRIISVSQPGLERIVYIDIEHLDEMGDLCKKRLIVEIMGKHSNIIFCKEDGVIIDSIKRVSGLVSSVREVLPGKTYFVCGQEKDDPLTQTKEGFLAAIGAKPVPLFKAIYMGHTGISPILAQEICYRADVDGERPVEALNDVDKERLWDVFCGMMQSVSKGEFTPCIAYEGGKPVEFAAVPLSVYEGGNYTNETLPSISELLENYYAKKNAITRIRQRSADLRKIVQTALERNVKKLDLQRKQMQDTEKREEYRIYGELINTYGYGVEPGSKSMEALNYYTNEMVTIPLESELTPQQNAKKYFDKYGKMKRTYEALSELTVEVESQIAHLESISNALDIALLEEDLVQIKEELALSGYIKKGAGKKREKVTSKPFHYISSDGYHIYVGKNNLQNEELTFKFANGGDWWFHAKGCPGSHVILKVEGDGEIPDRAFEEAGKLAAYYSSARDQEKVEIDYIQRKHVKKPNGGKPGFVVYYTNYSLVIDADISTLTQVN